MQNIPVPNDQLIPVWTSFQISTLDDLGLSIGPDSNAPQFTIENSYQVVDQATYTLRPALAEVWRRLAQHHFAAIVRSAPARRLRVSKSRSLFARRATELWRTHRRRVSLLRQSTSVLWVCSGRLESQTQINAESRAELRLPAGAVHGATTNTQLDRIRARLAHF